MAPDADIIAIQAFTRRDQDENCDLRAFNVATVVAAGNDGFGNAISGPTCISTAIGATDNSGNVTGFSNRGPLPDLFAPGVNVRSSVANDDLDFKSGTSM